MSERHVPTWYEVWGREIGGCGLLLLETTPIKAGTTRKEAEAEAEAFVTYLDLIGYTELEVREVNHR